MINLGTSTMQDFALGDNLVERIDLGDTTIFDPYTTLTGTLPFTFNSRAAVALKNYCIYGDSDGAGAETENLFDKNTRTAIRAWIKSDGELQEGSLDWQVSDYIPIEANENYTISNVVGFTPAYCLYDSNKNYISGNSYANNTKITFQAPADAAFARFSVKYGSISGADPNIDAFMVTKGSIAPDYYIPYGYKIPILMSNKPINLFDSSAVTIGKTIYSNGQIADSAYSSVSDYTKIPSNCSNLFLNWEYETLASSTVRNMVFYNSEKSVIGYYQYQSDVKTREIPLVTDTAYVRFSIDNNVSDIMLTEAPSTSNYDLFIGDSKLLAEEYLDYGEQKVWKRTENLVNSAKSESGYLNANDGLVRPSSATKTTDYIEIDISEDYSALLTRVGTTQSTSARAIAYYDESKTFISAYYGPSMAGNRVTFTLQNMPNNAKYVRFAYDVAFEQITFVSDSTPPETYIPYLQPTDPPAPLSAIQTYKGENTLSSTETVGEVTVKGRIIAISP